MPENGQHRSEIMKMMVHPDLRRQGIATMLLKIAEKLAMENKRTLIRIFSNEFTIMARVLKLAPGKSIAPPKSIESPGTPQCSNNGECTVDGCQCYDPWNGPSWNVFRL
eukprot:gene16363-19466_t